MLAQLILATAMVVTTVLIHLIRPRYPDTRASLAHPHLS